MAPRLLLLLLLALPGPLGAQAGPPASDALVARPVVSVLAKASRVAEEGRIHLGGWAGLALGRRLAIGGGGWTLLEPVELPGSEAGTGFDLRTGYGGLTVRVWEPLTPLLTAETGFLLGAGNAEVRNRLTGGELGSDNFFVVEPDVALSVLLVSGLRVGASLGYRTVWGLEDLPRVTEDDLESLTATLFLRLGGR